MKQKEKFFSKKTLVQFLAIVITFTFGMMWIAISTYYNLSADSIAGIKIFIIIALLIIHSYSVKKLGDNRLSGVFLFAMILAIIVTHFNMNTFHV